MAILLFFAFLSGLLTIFAPCIWPILPIVLSASSIGGRHKPIGITLGIMLSFALITLTLSYFIKILPFDPDSLRLFAVFVIGFAGMVLIFPSLAQKLESFVSRLSGKFSPLGQVQKTGFGSGFVTGLALGIVWTPCAGPILATIATLASQQAVSINVVFVTIAYVLGVGVPLFLFAAVGKAVFTKSRFLSRYTGRVQQIFGLIMLLSAVVIALNYDKVLQSKLLDAFPSYAVFITELENNSGVSDHLKNLK